MPPKKRVSTRSSRWWSTRRGAAQARRHRLSRPAVLGRRSRTSPRSITSWGPRTSSRSRSCSRPRSRARSCRSSRSPRSRRTSTTTMPRASGSAPSTPPTSRSPKGCDRPCSFCIIPKLRGPQRSREIADIVAEAQQLGREGVREINLIAQDLTRYGWDAGTESQRIVRNTLAQLLRALGKVDGDRLDPSSLHLPERLR